MRLPDADTPIVVEHGEVPGALRAVPDGYCAAAIMDPPYTAAGAATNGRSTASDTQFWAYWFADVWAEVTRVVRPDGCAFIFCDWRMIGPLSEATRKAGERTRGKTWAVTQCLVWDRDGIGLGSPFRSTWELIAFARGPEYESALPKNIANMVRCRWPYGVHENHGSEKPVDLCVQLVKWAGVPPGGVIVDPFAGSGTTGVAALREGRRAILVEREPEHVATCIRRLDAETRQGVLDLAGGAR